MKTSKKIKLGSLTLVVPSSVMAFWQIFVVIIVVCILGYVFYETVKVIKKLFEHWGDRHESVVGGEVIHYDCNPDLTIIKKDDYYWGDLSDPPAESSSSMSAEPASAQIQPDAIGFPVLYGIDIMTNAYVRVFTNNSTGITVTPIVDTTNQFTVSIGAFGTSFVYSTTNQESDPTPGGVGVGIGNQSQMPDGSATNSVGDILYANTINTNTQCRLVIKRSTDLINWIPVYTNPCVSAGFDPQLWTDTNQPYPKAFYKAVKE